MKLRITRYEFRDGTYAYMADTSLPHKLVMRTRDFDVEIPDEPIDAVHAVRETGGKDETKN